MNVLPQKIRIKDIARLAGVSAGSVDRVIHNRGNVSQKSMEKILLVMERINYKPNVIASALASRKKFQLACFLPETHESDYWTLVEKGILKAAEELSDFNLYVKYIYFNQFDEDSFKRNSLHLFSDAFDGVLLAPSFKHEALNIVTKLNEKNIPFSFIDSMVEDSGFLAYYGQHSYQSGYVAAKLLFSEIDIKKDILLFKIKTYSKSLLNQIENREKGFFDYQTQYCPKAVINKIDLHVQHEKELNKQLQQIFDQHEKIGGCIIFNSRAHIIARFLEENNIADVKLLGYDTIQKNVDYLRKGVISYLVGQRPETQGYKGLKSLGEKLIFKHTINPVNYMPIDILIKENIDYYADME